MRLRDWANLPSELLELIVERLVSNFVDVIRFRAVCRSWRLISLKRPQNLPPQLPWLMLHQENQISNHTRFYSLSDNRIYSIPSIDHNTCCGSSHGWLFLEDTCVSCSLLNPITGAHIVLPVITSIFQLGTPFDAWGFIRFLRENHESFLVKAVLSSSPSGNANCLVMLIIGHYHRRLAYYRLGAKSWIPVRDGRHQPFQDVVFFNGEFYAVDAYGRIVVCDLSDHTSPVTYEFKAPELFKADKTYLVESSGELLLIRRFRGWSFDLDKVYKTILFKVLRQDPVKRNWVEVKTLHNRSLFLGHNHSCSFLASDFFGCKGNCIYFTDNCFKDYDLGKAEPHDVGVFDLSNGSVEPLPGYICESQFLKQPPIWITPFSEKTWTGLYGD